jgi:hypothetical protein
VRVTTPGRVDRGPDGDDEDEYTHPRLKVVGSGTE